MNGTPVIALFGSGYAGLGSGWPCQPSNRLLTRAARWEGARTTRAGIDHFRAATMRSGWPLLPYNRLLTRAARWEGARTTCAGIDHLRAATVSTYVVRFLPKLAEFQREDDVASVGTMTSS